MSHSVVFVLGGGDHKPCVRRQGSHLSTVDSHTIRQRRFGNSGWLLGCKTRVSGLQLRVSEIHLVLGQGFLPRCLELRRADCSGMRDFLEPARLLKRLRWHRTALRPEVRGLRRFLLFCYEPSVPGVLVVWPACEGFSM